MWMAVCLVGEVIQSILYLGCHQQTSQIVEICGWVFVSLRIQVNMLRLGKFCSMEARHVRQVGTMQTVILPEDNLVFNAIQD